MFRAITDGMFGKTLGETAVPIKGGTLKIALKERAGLRYVSLCTSYPGDVHYHALAMEDVGPVIDALTVFRNEH